MNSPAAVRVTDPQGVHGTIDTTAWPLDGSRAEVLVQFESGQQVLVPIEVLVRKRMAATLNHGASRMGAAGARAPIAPGAAPGAARH